MREHSCHSVSVCKTLRVGKRCGTVVHASRSQQGILFYPAALDLLGAHAMCQLPGRCICQLTCKGCRSGEHYRLLWYSNFQPTSPVLYHHKRGIDWVQPGCFHLLLD